MEWRVKRSTVLNRGRQRIAQGFAATGEKMVGFGDDVQHRLRIPARQQTLDMGATGEIVPVAHDHRVQSRDRTRVELDEIHRWGYKENR
jgi:hypothetical protein